MVALLNAYIQYIELNHSETIFNKTNLCSWDFNQLGTKLQPQLNPWHIANWIGVTFMNPSGGYQSVLRLDDVDGVAKEEEKNEKKKTKNWLQISEAKYHETENMESRSCNHPPTWAGVKRGGEERMENITQMSNYRRKQTRLWQSPEKSSDSFQLQSDLYDMIRTRQMFHRCSQTQWQSGK